MPPRADVRVPAGGRVSTCCEKCTCCNASVPLCQKASSSSIVIPARDFCTSSAPRRFISTQSKVFFIFDDIPWRMDQDTTVPLYSRQGNVQGVVQPFGCDHACIQVSLSERQHLSRHRRDFGVSKHFAEQCSHIFRRSDHLATHNVRDYKHPLVSPHYIKEDSTGRIKLFVINAAENGCICISADEFEFVHEDIITQKSIALCAAPP